MTKHTGERTEVVILRLEPELRARVDSGSKDMGISRSEYIRRLIRCIPLVGTIEGDRVCFGSDNERE